MAEAEREGLELVFLSLFVITVNIVKRYKQPPRMELAHWKPDMLDFYCGLCLGQGKKEEKKKAKKRKVKKKKPNKRKKRASLLNHKF